ncbi:MAG: hemagglutinin repeat-containing protein [[Pasteurella] aerogenes]|nr:hemagglutinin repeat-containing protein [[Pasteurella] aerogenes]
MNKNKFRVIFNRTLSRFVVTSELARSADKSSQTGDVDFVESAVCFCSVFPLKMLSFGLFCALGVVSLVTPQTAFANLEIRADKSAPVNQQPIILSTANGIPQVNIQTPNDKGLSHNKYAQFDVDTKGAILNNSRITTQTQQGGLVTDNPYLARGEAKVILNEVNSSPPSVLKGYVEVAGKKADVIIANPSGIHCEGCGVINSGRTTFTTGNPHIKDGQVDSFTVEKGKVKVSGKGLDNSRVDYTEIIARETEMNAGIWSNKKLTVVTGENTIKRTATAASQNDNDHLKIIHTNPTDNAAQQTEKYAVDVSEPGGMYAGKIHLIGTEQGLGVRNAGHIGASAENLKIDSLGRIVNTGTMNTNTDVQLTTKQNITHRGKIENRRGNIHLSTQADIQQDGSIVARSGNINQQANTQITQQGETVAKGNITYTAPTITTSTSSLIAAGVDIKDSADGEVRSLETASSQGKHIVVTTSGKTTLQGKNLASGKIHVNAQEVNLNHSQTSANAIEAKASQGDIQANHATLIASRDLTLSTPKKLQTQNSDIKAEKITTKQTALNTKNALWEQTGSSDFSLDATSIENQDGSIVTQGNFAVNTGYLDNAQGKLATNKNLDIDTHQGELNSRDGMLFATENMTLNTGMLNNENGTILTKQNLQINTHNQSLNNSHNAKIQALGNLQLSTQQLDNRGGVIQVAGNSTMSAALINNSHISSTGSLLESNQTLTLNTPTLFNSQTKATGEQPTQGIIAEQLNINANTVDNQQGGIYVENQTALNITSTLDNNQGEMLSWGNLAILGYATDLAIQNSQGIIQAQEKLDIQAKKISEDGHLEANQISIQQKDDFNTKNDINAGSSLRLSTLGNVTNQHKLSANELIQLQTQNLDNKATASISASTALINAVNNVTNRGLMNSFNEQDSSETVIKAGNQLTNLGTGRIYGDHVALQADTITNKDETLSGNVSSATTAARTRLDLGARAVFNQTDDYNDKKKGGSFIYSGGEIILGRHLDANNQATGNTAIFRNNSSIVEAGKRIALNIDDIENNNIHYHSEVEETNNQTVNKSYIIPTEQAVYNDGNVTAISTDQLRRFSFSRTWKYAHDYTETTPPVIGPNSIITSSTALAMPNDVTCDKQGQCTLSKAGHYTRDSAVWKYFELTPPAEEMPTLTPEMTAALERVTAHEQGMTEEQIEAREKEIAQLGHPANPTPQESQDYALLAPYIAWTNKYLDLYKTLSEKISVHNDHISGKVYGDFWELKVTREITRENITKASLPAQILAGGDITYRSNRFLNDKSIVISGGNVTGELNQLTNRDDVNAIFQTIEKGERDFTHTKWRGGFKRYFQRKYKNKGELNRVKTEHKNMNMFVVESHKNPVSQPNYVNAKTINSVSSPQNNVNLTALSPYNAIAISARQDGLEVRALNVDTRLPTQSLHRINPQANSHVLIETDPDFTNHKKWLSSDYMYNALRHDHENVHKRLGDGYYEQRLVREQINQLTGRPSLGNYSDFESQYQELMNAGVTFAKAFNLTLGTKLSKEQVASLTSDIVWLEQETITLDDGSQQTVLVPKVYVVVKDGDLKANGALISANNLNLKTNELINQGTIAARNVAMFDANRLKNSGNLSAAIFSAKVNGDMHSTGNISADNALLLNVTGNFTHASTLRTDDVNLDGYTYKNTHLDRKGLLHVKDEKGTLHVAAGNLTLAGADIINDGTGTTYLRAKNALNLTALSTEHTENMGGGDHYRNNHEIGVEISRVQGKGDVILSGSNIHSEAAQLEADKRLVLLAENNITLGTATTTSNMDEYHKYKSGSSVAKTTKTTYSSQAGETEQGSQLSGNEVTVIAGKDIHATAIQLVADNDVNIKAGNNVSIQASTNHFKDVYQKTKKTSGVFTGGGIGITLGSKSEKHQYDTEGWTQSDARGALGSLNGNVRIQAGKQASILGSDFIAQRNKSIAIQGESLKVEAVKDIIESHESHEYKQSGLTIALSTPVTDAAMAAYHTARQMKQTNNSRLDALYAVKAATEMAQAVQHVEKVSDTLSQLEQLDSLNQNSAAAENPTVKISVGYGTSQQKTTTDTHSVTHDKSVISAGNIVATATGGKAIFEGVDIQAENAKIDAKLGIESKGVKDTYFSHTDSKNSSASVGVFVGFNGNSFGMGIEGSASAGKGKTDIDSETWQNKHWNVKKLETNSEQGGLTLDAATINAENWQGQLNSLTLQSRQDIEKYKSKSPQASASGSVAYGSVGSASYNSAKLDTAQVNEQAGIHIGKGGMDVTINGHTQLNGAVITSTAAQEKNKLTTQTISATDIENHSELKTESASVGTGSMAVFTAAMSAPGNKHETDYSTTKSAIGANIQLDTKDPNAQHINRDTENTNAKVNKQDLAKVQEQQEAAKLVGEISTNLVNVYTFNEREEIEKAKLEVGKITTEAKAKGISQKELENSDAYKKAQENLTALQASYENNYGIGSAKGSAIQAVTAALQGIAGRSVEQAAVGLASPYLNEKIKAWTTDPATKEVNKTTNLMAHAILGAIEAQVTGNNALAGAAAATTGEATAMMISEKLYDKPADKLTEDEKKNVVFLSQVASGLASSLVANDGAASTAVGSEIGKRTVENNYLNTQEASDFIKAYKEARTDEERTTVLKIFYEKSEKNDEDLVKTCQVDPVDCIDIINNVKGSNTVLLDENVHISNSLMFNSILLSNYHVATNNKWTEFHILDLFPDSSGKIKSDQNLANKLATAISTGKVKLTKSSADLLYLLNENPKLEVEYDPSTLRVSPSTEWRYSNDKRYIKEASGNIVYSDLANWSVFGKVYIKQRQDGSYHILDDKYDFDMQNWLSQPFRNVETWLGEPKGIKGSGVPYKFKFDRDKPVNISVGDVK